MKKKKKGCDTPHTKINKNTHKTRKQERGEKRKGKDKKRIRYTTQEKHNKKRRKEKKTLNLA